MASLLIKSDGFDNRVLTLNLGINRFGRSAENDFQIEHRSVSARHCEIVLGERQVYVRDCGSTNGTFLNDEPVQEAVLREGQVLRLGSVELWVENTDVRIEIPKFDMPIPAPPVVLPDGSLLCRRHRNSKATHRCTYCLEILCDACVTRLRRRGGKTLKLCPLCSHPVEVIGGEKKRNKSILEILQSTVKLPFLSTSKKMTVER